MGLGAMGTREDAIRVTESENLKNVNYVTRSLSYDFTYLLRPLLVCLGENGFLIFNGFLHLDECWN